MFQSLLFFVRNLIVVRMFYRSGGGDYDFSRPSGGAGGAGGFQSRFARGWCNIQTGKSLADQLETAFFSGRQKNISSLRISHARLIRIRWKR